MPAMNCPCGHTAGWPPFTCRRCNQRVTERTEDMISRATRAVREGRWNDTREFVEEVHDLAMLALQSNRYRDELPFREAVDTVLIFYRDAGR